MSFSINRENLTPQILSILCKKRMCHTNINFTRVDLSDFLFCVCICVCVCVAGGGGGVVEGAK